MFQTRHIPATEMNPVPDTIIPVVPRPAHLIASVSQSTADQVLDQGSHSYGMGQYIVTLMRSNAHGHTSLLLAGGLKKKGSPIA